jgi:cyanate permease
MTIAQPTSPKCFFAAWVLAWTTAVYLPSLMIAALSLSPLVSTGNLLLDAFEVADEVSPAAKLTYAILFGALVVVARVGGARRGVSINVLIGVVSIALVVALLPEYWSRGFGIGLNGVRFDPFTTTIYAIGGIASGVVFSLLEAKCLARSPEHALDRSSDH